MSSDESFVEGTAVVAVVIIVTRKNSLMYLTFLNFSAASFKTTRRLLECTGYALYYHNKTFYHLRLLRLWASLFLRVKKIKNKIKKTNRNVTLHIIILWCVCVNMCVCERSLARAHARKHANKHFLSTFFTI